MKKWIPLLLLVFTMFAWAANFHFTKITLAYYSPMGVASWRFLIAIIGLGLIIYWQYGKQRGNFKFSFKEWVYLFLTAFFGVFLTIYFFNAGLETTSAVNGSLIIATSPAITAVMAFILLKKKLKIVQWLAIFISFFGVVLILVKGDWNLMQQLQFELGDVYILGMALVFSLSQIIISKHLLHIKPIIITGISTAISLVLFALFSIEELITAPIPTNLDFWYSMLFLGFLGTALAYAAFYYCIVKVGPTTSTLYMNLIPFFAVLLAFPFGEKLYAVQLIGGGVIIAGLVVFGVSRKHELKKFNAKK